MFRWNIFLCDFWHVKLVNKSTSSVSKLFNLWLLFVNFVKKSTNFLSLVVRIISLWFLACQICQQVNKFCPKNFWTFHLYKSTLSTSQQDVFQIFSNYYYCMSSLSTSQQAWVYEKIGNFFKYCCYLNYFFVNFVNMSTNFLFPVLRIKFFSLWFLACQICQQVNKFCFKNIQFVIFLCQLCQQVNKFPFSSC